MLKKTNHTVGFLDFPDNKGNTGKVQKKVSIVVRNNFTLCLSLYYGGGVMKIKWRRYPRLLDGLLCLAVLVLAGSSCAFDIGNVNISKSNSDKLSNVDRYTAFEDVNFLAEAQALIFGPSATGGNSVVLGGFPAPNPSTGLLPPGEDQVPEGMVEIKSTGGRGKIAGSEDGITFYFKRLPINRNFVMEADFIVKEFGTSDATDPDVRGTVEDETLAGYGQNAFGIMARDHVPQWDNKTFAQTKNAEENIPQKWLITRGTSSTTNYFVGDRSGDSNMIMVGAVKQGARVCWREGIKKAQGNSLRNAITGDVGPHVESGNPAKSEYQDASQSKQNWQPREYGDYSSYVNSAGNTTVGARPDYPVWGSVYKLRLEKNNNGFEYVIQPPTDKDGPFSGRVPLADIVDSINKEEYYVGFFAARNARVWVGNIKYMEANAEDCDPYIPLEPAPLNASFEVVSPPSYTGENYIYAKSNVQGELVVIQNGKQIPQSVVISEWVVEPTNASAVPHNLFTIPTWDFKDGDNNFTLTFYPNRELPKEIANLGESGQALASAAAIIRTFSVTKKLYQGGTGDIWVGRNGNPRNSGDQGSPLDMQTAINHVQPGQTIIVKDGTYTMTGPIIIPRYNNGRSGALKTIKAETHSRDLYSTLAANDPSPRYRVAFDFAKNVNLEKMDAGFTLAGNYWKVEGFGIENSPNKTQGMIVSGHNNIVSWVTVHSSGDTGLQLSGSASEAKRYWPSGNLVEYCESFNNRDEAETDADGFAAKLTVGSDNRFLWCISHNNCDDGWDLFTKKETGAIGVVKFFGCVSYENKRMLNGNTTRAGGNGYKMGGEGISIRHVIRQSSSFGNVADAYSSNSNPSLMIYNSTAIGRINIRAGDSATFVDGKDIDCGEGPGSYLDDGILFPRLVNGQTYTKFLNRKADGRPDLQDVYKPVEPAIPTENPKGATAFYVTVKPEPEF